MKELLERFESYCKMSGIDLDSQFEALKENTNIDVMDVNDKYKIKINILKNALKGFLVSENQTITDDYLEFVIKISNLV